MAAVGTEEVFMTKRILLAGETFAISQSVSIGYDTLRSNAYANGAQHFLAAMSGSGYEIEHLASERCEAEFPRHLQELSKYSGIILSDIGALSLLFSAETRAGNPSPNRLVLLHDWVKQGGGLMMAGGYNSFQGMMGTARYHDTPVEDCLPVSCSPFADGLEAPEGLAPYVAADHPIVKGLDQSWPPVLGLNKVVLRSGDDCQMLTAAAYRGKQHPLLAIRHFGEGRSLAWMSDIGPHWMSQEFMKCPTYGKLMRNMVAWICWDI
jgi:uncharacterized membrane protein